MSEQTTFGRRRLQAAASPRLAAPRLSEQEEPPALSQAAEAFRSELAAEPRPEPAFAAWRRDRRGRRLVAWTLRFALLTPGIVCWVLQTPWFVSAALELAGIGAGIWLRYERQRHLREIAEWSSERC